MGRGEEDEQDEALVRLREVLAAPDRRSWRRHLRRRRIAADDAVDGVPLAARSGLRSLVALPLLAAAVILVVPVLRSPTDPGAEAPAGAVRDTGWGHPAGTGAAPSGQEPPAVPERVWPGEPVTVEGTTVRRAGVAWAAGGPGDVIVIGDWDCDEVPTPGVLRPSTGAFYVFDRWAPEGTEVEARVAGRMPGAVGARPTGCGSVVLHGGDGTTRAIETIPGAAS